MIINKINIEYLDKSGEGLISSICIQSTEKKQINFEDIEDLLIDGEYFIPEILAEIDEENTPRSEYIRENLGETSEDHPFTRITSIIHINMDVATPEEKKYINNKKELGLYCELSEFIACMEEHASTEWETQDEYESEPTLQHI